MKLTRREVLQSLIALSASTTLARGASELKFAICNETFHRASFAESCRGAKRAGFSGLEIAPFTLGLNPTALSPARRAELRRIMTDEGLTYVGLHALLTAPEELHVTTADVTLRRQSWRHLRELIDLSAALGPHSVMVFGSGKHRKAVGGVSVREAVNHFTEGLAALAPAAQGQGVTILIEPLSPEFTNVVNTLAEAVEIVRRIDSPAVQAMFDTHNTVAETQPPAALIHDYQHYLQHIHLNEMDGRHPGTGSYDFKTVLQALKDIRYRRWISVEVFDFRPGGDRIAQDSYRYLRQLERQLK